MVGVAVDDVEQLVADLAARIVPLGADPEARLASTHRTREVLATLSPDL